MRWRVYHHPMPDGSPVQREAKILVARRKLLEVLLFLAPAIGLASACEHRQPKEDEKNEDPFKREGGGY